MNTLALIAACAGAALMVAAPAAARSKSVPTGFLFKSLTRNDQTYPYAVYVPREYDASKPWPLIIFLHGAGECGTDGLKMCIQGLGSAVQWDAAKWPFIVVFAQKPTIESQWEQHETAVMAMLEQARKDYKVDASRIYLTGLSQGGHGTWIIGARHPELFAAIAPICGYGLGWRDATAAPEGTPDAFKSIDEIGQALKNTPLWAFHGDADTAVSVTESKELVAAVEKAGGHPKLTIYPGVDHNSWDKAYRTEDLGAWFLSHTLSR